MILWTDRRDPGKYGRTVSHVRSMATYRPEAVRWPLWKRLLNKVRGWL
jgi:hypothetical protein